MFELFVHVSKTNRTNSMSTGCKNILSTVSCFRLAKKGFCKRNGLVRTYCRLTCNTCISKSNIVSLN